MASIENVDAVIVGAGAGGGCAAATLAAHGLTTLILERGERESGDRFAAEDLSSQRSPWLVQGPGALGAPTHLSQDVDNGDEGVVRPNNAAVAGSGTVFYGGLTGRFLEADFKLRTRLGGVADAALEDWPVTAAELEPFYDRAEYEVGVAGTHEGNPFAAVRSRPFPMKPFPLTMEAERVRAAAQAKGLHPFPAAYLRNSVPYNGRPACTRQGPCDGFPCPYHAKNTALNTVIASALNTRHCQLRTRAMVTRLVVDDTGRLSGVEYVDETRGLHTVQAKAVILAAGSNATARLLLVSTSKRFPKGAGNNDDLVGRHLASPAIVTARGVLGEDIQHVGAATPGAGVALMDYCFGKDGNRVRGGLLYTDFPLTPAQFAQLDFPGVPAWGEAFTRFVKANYRRLIRVCAFAPGLPCAENRLRLDPKRRDYWGLPLVVFEGRELACDGAARCELGARARELVEACGAKQVTVDGARAGARAWSGRGPYQCGSCRMGADRAHGVCDAWGRVWDFPNLFIADGSLLVNSGSVPPALTIMALGFRVGDGVIRSWRDL